MELPSQPVNPFHTPFRLTRSPPAPAPKSVMIRLFGLLQALMFTVSVPVPSDRVAEAPDKKLRLPAVVPKFTVSLPSPAVICNDPVLPNP